MEGDGDTGELEVTDVQRDGAGCSRHARDLDEEEGVRDGLDLEGHAREEEEGGRVNRPVRVGLQDGQQVADVDVFCVANGVAHG